MTALVGILNKRAAVMAADSAVTATNGERTKIYNSANKIFNLSMAQPMGVMIYSSTEFMDTPWDVIFNLYRDRKGEKEYKTIKDFVNGFIDFLRSEDYFSDEEDQEKYFYHELREFYDLVNDEALRRYSVEVKEQEEKGVQTDDDKLRSKILKGVIEEHIDSTKDVEPNVEFKNYSFESMHQYGSEAFECLMELCKEDEVPKCPKELWERGFYAKMRSSDYYPISTGLVFVGYGSDDIYPSLLRVTISGVFDRRLRYFIDEENIEIINKNNSASICPYAQTDVMISLMKGVSPYLYNHVCRTNSSAVEETRQKMIEAAREYGATAKLLHKMEKIDLSEVEDNFDETVHKFIRSEYVDGIVDAVDSFNIKEMANMAESLISVTTLQRHISSEEESVGGPIDVAVITRSEGFIWVKHKEWYKQINRQ